MLPVQRSLPTHSHPLSIPSQPLPKPMTQSMCLSGGPSSGVFQAPRRLQNINCIEEGCQKEGGLFLGDIISVIKPEIVGQYQIGAVLSCLSENLHALRLRPDVLHRVLPARDTLDYPIEIHFEEAFNFIETARRQNKNVLVHCHAGVSRSASIVCAYLMRKRGISYQSALALVRERRYRAKPNENFQRALLQFEKKCKEEKLDSADANLSVSRINRPVAGHAFTKEKENYDHGCQTYQKGSTKNQVHYRSVEQDPYGVYNSRMSIQQWSAKPTATKQRRKHSTAGIMVSSKFRGQQADTSALKSLTMQQNQKNRARHRQSKLQTMEQNMKESSNQESFGKQFKSKFGMFLGGASFWEEKNVQCTFL